MIFESVLCNKTLVLTDGTVSVLSGQTEPVCLGDRLHPGVKSLASLATLEN